jgi:hypothetical protein
MLPAPPEASPYATSDDRSQLSLSPAQHGLPDTEQYASGGALLGSSPGASQSAVDDTDSVSISSGGTRRGRSANAGRISSPEHSSQEGSPGSRIDEYERAHTKRGTRSDGVLFQIVPSTGDKVRAISIEEFPNGRMPERLSRPLTNNRQRF